MWENPMHPTAPSLQVLAATLEKDRHLGEERRHALHRGLLEAKGPHPSWRARLAAALVDTGRRDDEALTGYACRLPNGRIGRVVVVQRGGDWTLVCRVA